MPDHWADTDSWGDPDDAFDSAGEDSVDTVPCPYCRRLVPEDAPHCPYCQRYISQEDAPPGPKPWWLVLGVFVCVLIVVLWILRP
jgi:hypothetical protein